jgi:hypothetical protein
MSDDATSAGPSQPQPATTLALLVRLWLGVLAFGLLNLPFIFLADSVTSGSDTSSRRLTQVIVFTLSVALVAALCWFALGWRRFTAGFLAGYVLMTIMSGGACTLLVQGSGFEGGLFTGVVLYPLAVLLFGIGLGIAALVARRQA